MKLTIEFPNPPREGIALFITLESTRVWAHTNDALATLKPLLIKQAAMDFDGDITDTANTLKAFAELIEHVDEDCIWKWFEIVNDNDKGVKKLVIEGLIPSSLCPLARSMEAPDDSD